MEILRIRILQLLNDERSQNPASEMDSERLTQKLGIPWERIRSEITYLEEKQYISLRKSHVGTRVFIYLRITASGIDFLESKLASRASEPERKTIRPLSSKEYEKEVFVSYAWGGESEHMVDDLEEAFANRGIRIVRDKKDLEYKGSIKTFEQRIGQGKCIVLVISDKYLRSEHCMYELVQVDENRNLRERVFPIVLADARIYKALDRLTYIKYWEERIEELNYAIKEMGRLTNLAGITADLDKYARIRSNIDHLTDLLNDMNALTPELHAVNGYSTLIREVERSLV